MVLLTLRVLLPPQLNRSANALTDKSGSVSPARSDSKRFQVDDLDCQVDDPLLVSCFMSLVQYSAVLDSMHC